MFMCTRQDTESTHSYFGIRVIHMSYVGHKSTGNKLSSKRLWVCLDRIYFAEIENWKHCSKIIFKYINSAVRPIFNEKVAEKWNLWLHEQCTDALFTEKSQHLRLLFMHCLLNSNRIPPKTRENNNNNNKKKKKKKKRTKTQLLQNADAT